MTDPLPELPEKDHIIDTINRLFICTERRDWKGNYRIQLDGSEAITWMGIPARN